MGRGLYENRSNLHPTTKAALVLIILAVLTDHIRAAQVQVQPDRALLNEGQKTELLCRYEKQIHYCRIEIPGEGRILNLSPIWNKTPGFTYFGAGLEAGECGVTIERVNASQNGKVKCTLGGEGDEYEGTIELVIALRPQQPVIELLSKAERDDSFAADSLFNARCVVRDGRPAANISWFIDDMPIVQGLSEPNVIDSMSDKNVTLSTTEQRMQKYLTPEDDGKMLICRAHHQTDRDQPQEGKFPLRVRYSPVPQPDATVYGLYLERTAMVNVTIRANPTPITEWTIEGIAIPQGTQQGRFSAYEPINIGNGYYNVTLAIAGLTLEDTTKTYYLKASNALGVRDYTVRISSSSTPPSAGLDIGSIVGIAVAVAVLVIVILLIGFARVTGRWCFGGATLNTDIGPDSEAQINPHLNDDFDGRDFSGDQHIDTTPQSEEVTPPVTDKLEAQKKADLKNSKNINGHHNGAKSSKTQASETHDETHQGPGPNVALLESGMTPNGVTILNNNNNENVNQNAMNGRQRNSASLMAPLRMSGRGNDDDDDSFEYATDRESSVYNPTTVPIKGVRSSATSRQSTATTASDSVDQPSQQQQTAAGGDLLARANQLGIPESRCSRWIPKDQRELLERPKNSERNQVNKPNQYFESSSDTESADIKTEGKSHAAKSQRLPSFTSLFMRKNEKSKKDPTLAADQTGNAAEGEQTTGETNRAAGADGGRVGGASTTGNANQPEEDKQIVYAELVLKPSDNQPIPQKNSTEYAEIVYVQKPTPGTVTADSADSKGKI